jgi:hypothetical protein
MTGELDDQVMGEPRGIFCQHDADVVGRWESWSPFANEKIAAWNGQVRQASQAAGHAPLPAHADFTFSRSA